MWNAEKQTYTCPKCGKTRILRSNSRTDLCPSCDQYSDRPQKIEAIDLRGKGTGINTVIHLWSDNRGMVLNYTQNDHNIATLYECGKLVGTINISAWCRSQGAVFSANAKHQDEKLQKIYESAVEKILFSSEVFDRKTENISTLRNVDPITAKVISLHEEGMDALPIALRLGIAFTEVMDILATIPPIVRGNDLNRHVVEHKISGNDTNFPKLSQKV